MAFEQEDQRRLEKTLRIRENIIDEILAEGTPKERADREFLLRTIEGLESTVISKTKVKVDEQNVQNQAQTQEMVANVLLRLSSVSSHDRRSTPVLSSDVSVDNITQGEVSVGMRQETYTEFMERVS